MKPEEIAALQENELRAHAPSLVKDIEDSAKKPLETQVGEMETAAKTTEPVVAIVPQLREILGLKEDTDPVEVIQAAVTKIKSEAKSLRDGILDKVLEKRFKGGDESDKSLVRRILVGEMESRDVKVTGNSENDEKLVSEMVTEIIDGDDSLKKVVSEMDGAPAAPPTTEQGNGNSSTGEWKPGMSTSNVRVKARV